MKRTKRTLRQQVKDHANGAPRPTSEYDGDSERMISTGSTLLDLAISGGRAHGGGVPTGILVEIFGPSSSGKTVLLCEMAGAVQRQGGQIMFKDPEARLNKQFARLFDLHVDEKDYSNPDTVPEVFQPVREWRPKPEDAVHGVFADSLAALSTDMEMKGTDGMGMRRAKEFSEECRKTCRVITNRGLLMVCSNQVRQNVGAGEFEPRHKTPGGESIAFYSSLRLRFGSAQKIKDKREVGAGPCGVCKGARRNRQGTACKACGGTGERKGKVHTRVIGVRTEVEVFKSTIWKPYRTAPLTIIFDYGIDDVRQNLQFVKEMRGDSTYTLGGEGLAQSMDAAIRAVEADRRERELREEVIRLWKDLEDRFSQRRRRKLR